MKREKLAKYLFWILTVALFLIVFKSWFLPKLIFGGDFYFSPFREEAKKLSSFPYAWESQKGNGLGGHAVSTLWIDTFAQIFPIFLIQQGLPGLLVQKLIFLFPFLILSFFSGIFVFKILFPEEKMACFLVPIIFGLNTYILMVVGGGQMGIAMAYALAPLVFGIFVKLVQSLDIKLKIMTGLALSLQVMFDPRISFLTIGAVFLYAVFQYGLAIRRYFKTFVLPFLITFGLHFYWLLPLVLVKRVTLPAGLGEPGWVEFLSFAGFSNSLSLLHPNWPENIFGKTYFMRPEFLVIPIIAFSALLFRRRNKKVLFFSTLALLGAFLAKGSKPPFGGVYLWLFKYFPGMNMFRDPTKFYLFVALSYSLLIPFSLEQIVKKFNKKFGAWCLVLGAFLIYWLFSIRPAWLGQLGGTFKAKEVPLEYVVLKDFIHSQEEFFRTFWIPKKQRFGFFSNNHPAIEDSELLSEEELALMGVKYVIIPFDSEGEIFLEDRKYDPEQWLALEEELDKVPWLKKIDLTEKIAVYQTSDYKDHFFIDSLSSSGVNDLPAGEAGLISWQMINPTKYLVSIRINEAPVNLVFSETYDELWQAKAGERIVPSTRYNNLNSFSINQTGDFKIMIEFVAQKYVYHGLLISAITLLTSCGALVYLWRKQ